MSLVLCNTQYQNILKWLWNDMKMNSLAEFENVDWTRAGILVKKWKGKPKGVDETHPCMQLRAANLCARATTPHCG